jgi:prevent-host-death family protein
MRTITALEVRAKFGQVLDEAAAGERFIVERAGQPVAAIVPLRDLERLDPARERDRRHAALHEIELRHGAATRRGHDGARVVADLVAGIRAERGDRAKPAPDDVSE